MGSFSGKVALITGGARVRAAVTRLALAQEGCDVALVDIASNMPTIEQRPCDCR